MGGCILIIMMEQCFIGTSKPNDKLYKRQQNSQD